MDIQQSSSSGAVGAAHADAPSGMEPRTAPQTRVRRPVQLGRVATNREILMHGQQAFQRGEDASALESLTRLTGRGVRFADVHYMIGMLHEHSGETEAAIVSLQEAIRINPSYVEALLALASLHERSGDYERSRGYAERASQLSRPSAGGLDPTTRGKLANQQAALAAALVEAGERRDAIEQYRCALDRCPAFHDIRHQLGITLREAGLPAQAVQEFTRILRRRPGMLESQIQLGLTYYSMGRTPEAIREWGAVLQKDPSRDEARMYLRLVSGARHAGRVGATPLRPAADPARDLSIPPAMAVRSGAPDGAEISSWTTTELARDDSEESSG